MGDRAITAMADPNQMGSELSPVDPAILAWAEYWSPIAWKGLLAASAATIVAACLAAAFLALQWRTTTIRERQSDWRTSSLELQAKRADADLERAKADIALADARSAEANVKALQAQAELTKFKTPRTLSPELKTRMIDALKAFPGMPFDLSVNPSAESEGLAAQIATTLESAGWTWQTHPNLGSIIVTIGQHSVRILSDFIGLGVEIDQSKTGEWRSELQSLCILLREAVPETKCNIARDGSAPPNALHIYVGTKI